MRNQVVEGKWDELKGRIRKAWGNVTNDDLEKAHGNLEVIEGIIRQKYGTKTNEIRAKLDSMINEFSDTASTTEKRAKKATADVIQKIEDRLN